MASPSIAPREYAVSFAGGITLAASAWIFGGIELWSQHALLAGSALTFLLAICPMPKGWNGRDGEHSNRRNVIRLLQFPVFWFSLLLISYIVLQAFNPSWELMRNEKGWWVEEIDAIDWLPTSVKGEYEQRSAFRALATFLSAIFLVWGLWVGIRRRRSALALLWVLVLSGTAMAIVAMIQQFTEADAVLWSIKSANKHFWGSFFYRNQAVAYLTLILVAAAALFFYHYNRSEKTGQSGGPHLLLFVMMALVFASIGLALSRGGILFSGVFMFCFLLLAFFRWLMALSVRGSVLISLIAALLLGIAALGAGRLVDYKAIEARFGDIGATIENVDEDARMVCTKITWMMAKEEWVFGWGAGSWHYIFPMYQKSYPEVFYVRYHPRKGWMGRRFFKQAHNDVVQFFCELGIVGYSFFLLPFLYWLFSLLFRTGGNFYSAIVVILGILLAFGHAFVEFIFQSPAYWLAFNGLLCLAAKLLMLEHQRRHRSLR